MVISLKNPAFLLLFGLGRAVKAKEIKEDRLSDPINQFIYDEFVCRATHGFAWPGPPIIYRTPIRIHSKYL